MNQSKMDWEYTLEESEKIHPMVNKLDCSNHSLNLEQVVVELRLLSMELTMSVDILGRIQNSVHVLVQSLEEQS